MRMPVTAEDILIAVFCHLERSEYRKVIADREMLHKAFYRAKEKHPKAMRFFSFREREFFPESKQLDQALSNLDAAGIISRQNLTPRYYRLESLLQKSFDNFSKKILCLAGIEDREIRDIADEVRNLVAEGGE